MSQRTYCIEGYDHCGDRAPSYSLVVRCSGDTARKVQAELEQVMCEVRIIDVGEAYAPSSKPKPAK